MDPSDSHGPALHDHDIVSVVVQSCGCDEAKAIDLLTRSKGDPIRAIKFHSLLSKYREKVSPRPSRAITPNTPLSEASLPDSLSGDAEPEDDFTLTPERGTPKYSTRHLTNMDTYANTDQPAFPIWQGNYFDTGDTENHDIHSNMYDDQNANSNGQSHTWDLVLPVIPLPLAYRGPNSANSLETFNIRDLIAIVQNGAGLRAIQNYLGRFDESTIRKNINNDIEGFPAMFYVVETNNEDILRTWVGYGGDPAAIHKASQIPLLAFAIMHSENIQADTTLMTATLLSLGASPDVIPSAFYSPYLQDLPEHGPSDESLKDLGDENKSWCKDVARVKLARTSTLSQRYYLERAAKTKKPSRRQTQVAQRMKAEPLLGIANFLIGQTIAAKSLLATLLAHLTEPGKKPLVLVFAGPSGHGKTELARRLGHLLSLELEVVDCTIFNREMELFGPRHPYVGAERGTPLNNFLAKNHEQRCIVFLDEFEKTSPDIHKTLLLPFENGEYQDRRNLNKVNCSQTIWILATNAHDPVIQDFSSTNSRVLLSDNDDETESKRLLKQLSYKIRDDFQSHHGPPITGRISEFLPFLPFSIGEQAVIVHKSLLELGRKVQRPVNLSDGPDAKLLGNIRLRIRRDASVCRVLAESEYHSDLGARSLIAAGEKIKRLLVEEYLSIDEDITEEDGMSEFTIDVNGGEVVVNMVPPKPR